MLPAVARTMNGSDDGNNNPGNDNGNGNTSRATISNREARNMPSVFAPGLAAAGIQSRLGSSSMGRSAGGFGVTFGSTMFDRGCRIRLFARTLNALGSRRAATQILCNDPELMLALAYEGISCRELNPAAPEPAPRRKASSRSE